MRKIELKITLKMEELCTLNDTMLLHLIIFIACLLMRSLEFGKYVLELIEKKVVSLIKQECASSDKSRKNPRESSEATLANSHKQSSRILPSLRLMNICDDLSNCLHLNVKLDGVIN